MKNSKIAFIFPGQGSQYLGMGKSLYENYEIAKRVVDYASNITGINIMEIPVTNSMEFLNKPSISQVLILTYSVAMYSVIQEIFNIKPAIYAGHSLGELSALVCSGTVTFRSALSFALARGDIIEKSKIDGKMLAINSKNIIDIISNLHEFEDIDVANINSDTQIVVSGGTKSINILKNKLDQDGVINIMLNIKYPFHSNLLNPLKGVIENATKILEVNHVKKCIYCSTEGKFYKNKKDIFEFLTNQTMLSVNWFGTVKDVLLKEADTLIEIGPQCVLRNFIIDKLNRENLLSLDDNDDFEFLRKKLEAVEQFEMYDYRIDYLKFLLSSMINLENYQGEINKELILKVKEQDRKYRKYKKCGITPSINEIIKINDLAKEVLKEKGFSISKIKKVFELVIIKSGYLELLDKEVIL